jgi:hypothetical protein
MFAPKPKARFIYRPYFALPNLTDYIQGLIEIIVDKCYITLDNKAYRERTIWGSETYTQDSDPVCIIQHMGIHQLMETEP